MTKSGYVHFVDLDDFPITDFYLGNIRRGQTGNPGFLKVVNDGQAIGNVTLKISGSNEVDLSLPESDEWGNEINFPLPYQGSQEFKIRVRSETTDTLTHHTCDLKAIISLDSVIEDL